jgi:hypothetical protein
MAFGYLTFSRRLRLIRKFSSNLHRHRSNAERLKFGLRNCRATTFRISRNIGHLEQYPVSGKIAASEHAEDRSDATRLFDEEDGLAKLEKQGDPLPRQSTMPACTTARCSTTYLMRKTVTVPSWLIQLTGQKHARNSFGNRGIRVGFTASATTGAA